MRTLTWPPGMATTVTRLPMQRLGTDHRRPAARTSIVAGTVCALTSPTIPCSSRMLPTGLRASFSRMNRALGGSPVVSLGSSLLRRSMRATHSRSPSQPVNSPSYARSLERKRLALSSLPFVSGLPGRHSASLKPASSAKRQARSTRLRLPPENATRADMLSVSASSGVPPKVAKASSRHESRSSVVLDLVGMKRCLLE